MTEETRDKIIDASMTLFAQKGYKQTTTKAIAKAAGVNEVTIFRQFQNKEGIVREIVQTRLPYLRRIQAYFKEKATYEVEQDLLTVADMYYRIITSNLKMLMVLSHEMGPAFQDTFMRIPQELLATFSAYFSELQRQDKIQAIRPEILALSFTSSTIGLAFINELFEEKMLGLELEKYLETSVKIFVKGISI